MLNKQLINKSRQKKCPSSKKLLKKSALLAKNVLGVVEEMIEAGSIAYSGYVVLVYNPELEGKYGYAIVATGAGAGGLSLILNLNSVISHRQYHNYRLIKEALAGAMVAAIFTEEFFPETNATVAIGGAVALVLTSSKALIELFENKKAFKTKPGKIFEYTIGSIYNAMMGAGIADYLFAICKGFGVQINPFVYYGVTAGLSIANVVADLPINKLTKEDNSHHFCYHPARFYRSFLYGSEITLFLTIFIFDMITNIQESTDIKDPVFYSVLAFTLMQGFIIMVNKLINDKKEEHELHSEHGPDKELLLDKPVEKSKTSLIKDYVEQCWMNFWHSKKSRELQIQESKIPELN